MRSSPMTLRRRCATVVTCLLLAMVGACAPQARESVPAGDPASRGLQRLHELRVPGAAVVVQRGNGPVEERYAGRASGRTVDGHTPVIVGSVAKSFTATAVVRLVREGRLRLDERVAARLPELRAQGAATITVEQLLSHTSGYDTAAGLRRTDRPDNTPDALARLVADVGTEGPRGIPGQYAYSDANYLILGRLVEVVTGMEFAQSLRTQVLQPAGLHETHADAPAVAASGVTAGHRAWWGVPVPFDHPWVASGVAYGYLVSTPRDLLRHGRAQLAPGAVLDAQGLAALRAPRAATGPGRAYAAGWRVEEMPGLSGPVLHHTGATPGTFTHVLVDRRTDTVVVITANAYSSHWRRPSRRSVPMCCGNSTTLHRGAPIPTGR